MSQTIEKSSGNVNEMRRTLLRGAGSALIVPALGMTGVAGSLFAGSAIAAPTLTPLKFAWNQSAFCSTPVAVAKETGIFEKNGLDVTLDNFGGTADQLLEALATGKADAAIGMIHLWLKPLESGFDVKIVGSVHAGCIRLIGYKPANVTKLEDLRGKTIGVASMGAPGKHFFSVYLKKHGIDPEKDVVWRAYPRDLLGVAAEKGEIQAVIDQDPQVFVLEKHANGAFVEIATNRSGEYHNKICCVVGVQGELLRKNKPAATAVIRSLIEAGEYTAQHPDEGAKIFHKYATGISLEELQALYGTLDYHHHPVNTDLRSEIAWFADDFRGIGVLKPSTDPQKFASAVYADVFDGAAK
ncbi:ABC transporter substrate-binding protein [Betaproteobacteria bacterium]|nr:ABC transporter substrate-binding protein [Betaproteobacteria bacterium]